MPLTLVNNLTYFSQHSLLRASWIGNMPIKQNKSFPFDALVNNWCACFMAFNLLLNSSHALSQVIEKEKTKPLQLSTIEIKHKALQVIEFAEQGQLNQGEVILDQFLHWPYSTEMLPLLKAKARLHNIKKDFVNEAATYRQILNLLPDNNEALHRLVFATFNMGAPHLALKFASKNRGKFTKEEWLKIQQASSGQNVKWGTLESNAGIGQQRFQSTDKLLLRDEMVRDPEKQESKNLDSSDQLTDFDRLVALRDRNRMHDVIALYEKLKQQKHMVPAHALVAVADAYLYLRKPDFARELYLEALTRQKNNPEQLEQEWQLKLFNAHMDANDFEASQQLIDRLVNKTTPVINKGLKGVELDNELYEQARVNQIRSRLFADQLKEGRMLIHKTLEAAPFNIEARLALADLFQLTEQPRAAQLQYFSVLVDDPANNAAAVGIAETAVNLRDSKTAREQLQTLLTHYPENLEVQRVQHLYHANTQPSLAVTSGWGRSPAGGGNRGNRDWNIDTQLHSALLLDHWRIFSHTFNAKADFNETTAHRERIGLGAEYQSPAWQITGEVNQDQSRFSNYGFDFSASWQSNDYWKLNLALASDSNDIPLQASAEQIKMQKMMMGFTYVNDASRNIYANLSHAWFSDSNNRTEAGLGWQERWVSGPIYKLDTLIDVSASRNTLKDAAYFNPGHDYAVNSQLINEWTLWRNYQQSFKNRLTLGVGNYWQQGFPSGITQQVRYEQEWTLDVARAINYGIAYEKHPYDGEQSETSSLFFNFNWHF